MKDEASRLGVCGSNLLSYSMIEAFFRFRLPRYTPSRFAAASWNPRRDGLAATGRNYLTSLVTNNSIQDFIHMNAPAKDISHHEFSPLSIFGLASLSLYGGIGSSSAGTADTSAGHQ
jgi:hypothetical protein